MEEIDNFNFLVVREHYMYELQGQVGHDLQGVPRVSIPVLQNSTEGNSC
jgi:hypothetical protein